MTAVELWDKFCESKGVDKHTKYEAWAFGAAPDNLAALVMLGVKTATASGYEFYFIDESEPLPKVGDYSVIMNSKQEAMCVIQTTKLYVSDFDMVSDEQAFKEGEGDRTLCYWRKVHEDFFKKECQEYHMKFTEKFKVLCEEFVCLYSIYEVSDLTEQEAKEICHWRYDGEYAIYNLPKWDECVKQGWALTSEEKRKGAYFSVNRDGEFLGYFHIMDRGNYVELGVGIKPKLCGNHNGNNLMNLALAKIEHLYGHILVKLTVRPFNKRAIKCYENVGFVITDTYYEDSYIVPGEMHVMQLHI